MTQWRWSGENVDATVGNVSKSRSANENVEIAHISQNKFHATWRKMTAQSANVAKEWNRLFASSRPFQ